MKSGDWRQIEDIFQEALQHDPANCLPGMFDIVGS
jgi:hypothetical protein